MKKKTPIVGKKKILISWMAKKHDFTKDENGRIQVNQSGTHFDFYQNLFDYDEHHLLATTSRENLDNDPHFPELTRVLSQSFPNYNLKPRCMGISDVINIDEIKTKLVSLISELSSEIYQVEIYTSPGTPAMQTAAYLIAGEYENVKIFQVRPPHERNGALPQKIYTAVTKSDFARVLENRVNDERNEKVPSDLFRPEIIDKVLERAYLIAHATVHPTVLIHGETGTGKDIIANYIHENSIRKGKDIVVINCAAYNDDLLESRLFGYKEGAFTGANKDTKGAFEHASGSTLFLDEIGDISPKFQQTLLRVLQDGIITPVGGFEKIPTDVRVIVASHKNLFELKEKGLFRADLFYRLAVAEIECPSLRELPLKDKKACINHFNRSMAKKLRPRKPLKFSKQAEQILLAYAFPGNIRELIHLMERLYAFCNTEVRLLDLPKRVSSPEGTSASQLLEDMEKQHIQKVLHMFSWNKSRTYKTLGIAERTLDTKIKKYKLTRI